MKSINEHIICLNFNLLSLNTHIHNLHIQTIDLLNAEGLNPDYIALAAWSLSRAFVKPNKLSMHTTNTKESYPKAVPKVSTVIETTGKKKKGGIERTVELKMYGGGGLSGLEDDMVGNDNMYRQLDDDDDNLFEDGGGGDGSSKNIFALSEHISLPTMEDITDEVLLRHPNESPLGMSAGSKDSQDDDDEDDEPYYEHNDTHASNGHRFYLLNGLASDATSSATAAMPTPRGFTPTRAGANNSSQVVNIHGSPLTIAEIASAGLTSLRAKSRIQAEKDMVSSSLFQQFVQAASAGGFFSEKRGDEKRFNDSSDDTELSAEEKERRSQLLYQDKYRKVVNKFRSKLANKEAQILNPPTTPSHPYHSASPRMNSAYKIMSGGASVSSAGGNTIDSIRNVNGVNDRLLERRERRMEKVKSQRSKTKVMMPSTSPSTPSKLKEDDYQEAERFNTTGNTLMQEKQFQQALDAYTSALARPVGPNSHVYYSNRSAAYLSLNQYDESIRDSEKSLALQPNYAKAYSRLGLTYFACGRYSDAVTAYESALRIDPDNEWTRDHLSKAQEMIDGGGEKGIDPPSEEEDEENWPTPFDNKNSVKEEIETGGKGGMTRQEQEEQTRQADNYKDKGNEYMSNKDYDQALQQYNLAIELSPSGPHSHVYYSNRAAAYCYLANYLEATADCETSIKLMPTYEKAHARLGLSFFFRGQYDDAIAAYNRSLELDPNNKASMSYLKKAKARLAEQKKKEEEEHLRADEERERNRTRMQWLAQQRQYQQQNNNQQQQQQGGEDDEGSLGDNTGITSTGLTSIVTNNDDEVEVSMSVEAFDPFSTKDDE